MTGQRKKLIAAGVIVVLVFIYVVFNPNILDLFVSSFQTAYDEAGQRQEEKEVVENTANTIVTIEKDMRGVVVIVENPDFEFIYPNRKDLNIFGSKDRGYGEVYIDSIFVGKMFDSVYYIDFIEPGEHNIHIELFDLEGNPLESDSVNEHIELDFST